MSFIKKIVEATARGFEMGEDAVQEYTEHRRAANLFLKLGVAVYAEQRLNGSHDPVERILLALDGHAAEHGEVDLDHLDAAREVLGEEFISELNTKSAEDEAASAGAAAPAPAPAPAAVETPAAPAAPAAAQ